MSFLLPTTHGEPVDERCLVAGPEAVVDIHDRYSGRAAIEHGEQGRDAAEARAVADAGGDPDDGARHKAADDAGERALHSGHHHGHIGFKELLADMQQPVYAGHPDVVDAVHAASEHLCGHGSLFGHRDVRGPGGHHRHPPCPLGRPEF